MKSSVEDGCATIDAIMPSSLGPRGSYLKLAVFEDEACRSGSAPFLISLPFLMHCGIQLHLHPTLGLLLSSKKLGFSARCHLGPTGALRVFLQDFTEDKIRLGHKIAKQLSMSYYEQSIQLAQRRTLYSAPPVQ